MDIKEAIKIMEEYMEGILEYPDPYRDPDIEALDSLIEFVKSKL